MAAGLNSLHNKVTVRRIQTNIVYVSHTHVFPCYSFPIVLYSCNKSK